jgi:hypothetical protein
MRGPFLISHDQRQSGKTDIKRGGWGLVRGSFCAVGVGPTTVHGKRGEGSRRIGGHMARESCQGDERRLEGPSPCPSRTRLAASAVDDARHAAAGTRSTDRAAGIAREETGSQALRNVGPRDERPRREPLGARTGG